jgi:hypothetical protein
MSSRVFCVQVQTENDGNVCVLQRLIIIFVLSVHTNSEKTGYFTLGSEHGKLPLIQYIVVPVVRSEKSINASVPKLFHKIDGLGH